MPKCEVLGSCTLCFARKRVCHAAAPSGAACITVRESYNRAEDTTALRRSANRPLCFHHVRACLQSDTVVRRQGVYVVCPALEDRLKLRTPVLRYLPLTVSTINAEVCGNLSRGNRTGQASVPLSDGTTYNAHFCHPEYRCHTMYKRVCLRYAMHRVRMNRKWIAEVPARRLASQFRKKLAVRIKYASRLCSSSTVSRLRTPAHHTRDDGAAAGRPGGTCSQGASKHAGLPR